MMMKKDERVERLQEGVSDVLSLATCILGELDTRLDEMTNSEWGNPTGQKLVAISNCMLGAKISLQDALNFIEAIKAFDN